MIKLRRATAPDFKVKLKACRHEGDGFSGGIKPLEHRYSGFFNERAGMKVHEWKRRGNPLSIIRQEKSFEKQNPRTLKADVAFSE